MMLNLNGLVKQRLAVSGLNDLGLASSLLQNNLLTSRGATRLDWNDLDVLEVVTATCHLFQRKYFHLAHK